ncbi:chymotrypsin-related [Holotrichia oblita]|uniref:Chymotrypsin-related n=1 Tax=Holotrichia oblita TaxID=644536 RepID=A0ACB9TU61_HOLOL|nr:chymotrypsin-related [Holotrichia oblita]
MQYINVVKLTILLFSLSKNAESAVINSRNAVDKWLFNARVYNGEEVEPHSIPYQVSCIAMFATSVEIILGAHDLNDEDIPIRLNSTVFILHEDFIYTVANDIAVIKLPEPIEFTETIQPVNFPTHSDRGNLFVNYPAAVSGWGRTEAGTGTSNVLLRINTTIITSDMCAFFLGDKVKNDLHICTTGIEFKAPCNGDSGGPLVIENVQVGIVSFGFVLGCSFGFPNGYTRVTHYLDWIQKKTDINVL